MATEGFDPVCCGCGEEAVRILCGESAPSLAVLDWMMPGVTGPDLCRQVREANLPVQPYLIILTVRTDVHDIMSALDAGANDHVRKPFSMMELMARVRVGKRVVELQIALRERIVLAEAAQGQAGQLRGLLPVCAYCRKVRDDQDYWYRLEAYLAEQKQAELTHGLCPECKARMAIERNLPPNLQAPPA